MGKLNDFVDNFFDICQEDRIWEFWIHKETGLSWEDFKLECIPQEGTAEQVTEIMTEIDDALSGGEYSYGRF